MSVVIELFYRPAMLMRKIHQLGKSRVAKPEAGARIVRLRRHTQNCMHELIEQAAMRDDQISAGFALDEILQCLTGPQEEFPIPSPSTPTGS